MRNETKTSAAVFASIQGRGGRLNFKAWVRFEAVIMRSRVIRAAAYRRRAIWLWEKAILETVSPAPFRYEPQMVAKGSPLTQGKRRRVVMNLEKARQLRAERGLTRAQLVEKYGICSSQISSILAGRAWPETSEVA
jgi:hypothetical protein